MLLLLFEIHRPNIVIEAIIVLQQIYWLFETLLRSHHFLFRFFFVLLKEDILEIIERVDTFIFIAFRSLGRNVLPIFDFRFWRGFFVDLVEKVKFNGKLGFFLFFFFHVAELLKWNCFFLFPLIRLIPTRFWVVVWIFSIVKIIFYFPLTIFLLCAWFTRFDVKITKLFECFCTLRRLETFFCYYFEIEFFIRILLIFLKINFWWFLFLFWNWYVFPFLLFRNWHVIPFFFFLFLSVNAIIIFWNR